MRHLTRLLSAALVGLPLVAMAAEPPGAPSRIAYADAANCGGGSAFTVANQSRVAILELYVRPSGATGNWGIDRLGEAMLEPGRSLRLDPGQGVFDLLLLRADGRAFTALRQSSCSVSAILLQADERVVTR